MQIDTLITEQNNESVQLQEKTKRQAKAQWQVANIKQVKIHKQELKSLKNKQLLLIDYSEKVKEELLKLQELVAEDCATQC